MLDIDGLIAAAAAAAIAALLDAATAAAASVSSNVTVCAVTREGKPAPCSTPAIIPLRYESTDNPPKSAGILTKVLKLID